MLDPSLTNVLKPRIVGSIIDLGIIGVLSAAFARSQAEVFTIVERDPRTDEPIWSAEQFDRLVSISETFNRTLEIGDTIYVLSGTGLYLSVLVLLLLGLVVKVLIPANLGWSPGQRILGLRVADRSTGEPAALGQHLLRTAGGVIDAFPYVVPGLTGWLLASRSAQHQRIGDRIGRTLVIDRSRPVRMVGDPTPPPARELATKAAPLDDSMVDLDARLGAARATVPEIEPYPTAAVPVEAATEQAGVETEPPPPTEQTEPPPPVAETEPPPPTEQTEPPPPVAETSYDPSQPIADSDIVFDSSSELAPPEPEPLPDVAAPSPMEPVTLPTADESDPTPTDHEAPEVTPAAEPADDALPPPPSHRSERTEWEEPIAEPAPVWTPEPGSPAPDVHRDPVPVEQVQPAAHHEPSQAAQVPVQQAAVAVAEPGPAADIDPQWSDEWQSWLFWDPKGERWLRHDTDTNRWVPIS